MRGLTYEEVEGSVDCSQNCSDQAAGFAYAQAHDIENDADCNNPSRSFVEGCEAYGQEIDECLTAAREAIMQDKQPADRCPMVNMQRPGDRTIFDLIPAVASAVTEVAAPDFPAQCQ